MKYWPSAVDRETASFAVLIQGHDWRKTLRTFVGFSPRLDGSMLRWQGSYRKEDLLALPPTAHCEGHMQYPRTRRNRCETCQFGRQMSFHTLPTLLSSLRCGSRAEVYSHKSSAGIPAVSLLITRPTSPQLQHSFPSHYRFISRCSWHSTGRY